MLVAGSISYNDEFDARKIGAPDVLHQALLFSIFDCCISTAFEAYSLFLCALSRPQIVDMSHSERTQVTDLSIDGAVLRTTKISGGPSKPSSDDLYLTRLGKRPLMNRNFGFMSILGFSCSALLSWEGILVTSITSLINGGPAGAVWSLFINWIGTMSVNAALGELASIAPTAAGQCKYL